MPSAQLITVIGAMRRVSAIRVADTIDAAHEALLVFARRQVTSSGAYGGRRWAGFAGEPRYEAYKRAQGALALPLRWKPGQERLVPALTDPRHPDHVWAKTQRGFKLDITVPYLDNIERGGVNQYGERYPARRVFPSASPELRGGVVRAVTADLVKRVEVAGLKVSR